MCKVYLCLILLSLSMSNIWSAVIPIKLDPDKGNTGNLEFAFQLPNNDTVKIDLSFQLLTLSKNLNEDKVNDTSIDNATSLAAATTTTTTTTPTYTSTDKPEPKYITVQEAIEGFRQDLIKKEKDIAGIIESDHLFYRHFKLQFLDDLDLTIRCTYDSNYRKRTLNISCYEYHEYETERILSNGEIEMIRVRDSDYKTDVEFIDARNVKQVYKMDIS